MGMEATGRGATQLSRRPIAQIYGGLTNRLVNQTPVSRHILTQFL